TCDAEAARLRKSAVDTVVLAVTPLDAVRCGDAAARMGWQPAQGFLVAPSAAYEFGNAIPLSLRHARTVLGLPWPLSPSAGANRYRAAMPGSASYRALVSFAAA